MFELSCARVPPGCTHSPLWYLKALGDRLRSAVGVAVIGCGALCSLTSPRLVAGPSLLPDVTGVVS